MDTILPDQGENWQDAKVVVLLIPGSPKGPDETVGSPPTWLFRPPIIFLLAKAVVRLRHTRNPPSLLIVKFPAIGEEACAT